MLLDVPSWRCVWRSLRRSRERGDYWVWLLTGVGHGVARQGDGATGSPVAWGRARAIGDDLVMMVAGVGWVKWAGVVGVVGR